MDRLAKAADWTVAAGALLLATVYLVSGILYLSLGYWPVTESDFWQIYDVCLNHSWLQSALLKFNNHSLFFPSFIWLADLHFFHGSQAVLFWVSLALLIISTLLFLLTIWRQPGMDLTGKCLGTLIMICGSFWMGRGAITASGGFNCITSLALLGATGSFLLLPRLRAVSPDFGRTTALLIAAGFVATFSFGSGIAVWPALFFLCWILRLPWKSLAILVLAALSAALIYRFLPPAEDASLLFQSIKSHRPSALVLLKHLCWLAGAPIFYSITAWQGVKPSPALVESSGWLLWGGAIGLALALFAMVSQLIRRDIKGGSLEFLGLALISFNFCVLFLVIASRVERFQEIATDPVAPRYLFWTSLFWAGLLLLAVHHAQRRRWLRWPCILLVFAFAIAGWQEHKDEGLHWRYARLIATQGATSVINGIADPQKLLASSQEEVDRLAPQLRARRLDMFAEGLQDWIGRPAAQLFDGREDKTSFRGRAAMQRLTGGRDQPSAVRISGQLTVGNDQPWPNMVVVDSGGTVVGVARAFFTNSFLNRLLYGGRMPNGQLAGYIPNHQAGTRYALRAAGPNGISTAKIDIAPLPHQPDPPL